MITPQQLHIVWLMLLSIAEFEGFFINGSRAQRNNNPGNLKGWDPNLPKDKKGFDIFPDLGRGIGALWTQIWINIFRDLTIREFFEGKPGVYPGYAPLPDGNTTNYAKFVSNRTGIPLDNVEIKRFIGV